MPKETFFHLREEKQKRIMDAALQEIAEYGYDKASVTRIVKDAGIATGSFYQYFEDLADVFIYIGMEAGRMKAWYMQRELAKAEHHTIESFIRAMYKGGLHFGLEHEEYFRCAQSFLQMKDTKMYRRIMENVQKSDLAVWLYQFVGQAIENGELAEGITPELFFRLVTDINTTIIEYQLAKKPGGQMNMEDLEMLYDLGITILLHGIQKHKDEA